MDFDYLIRVDGPDEYTITKWGGGKEPLAVYKVSFGKKRGWKCNCPAGHNQGQCHHPKMIRDFEKLEKIS